MPDEARRPRRSPEPAERQRDAERTRERIVAAALEEFGAKGFAGARVSEIAARAGINKQLISYYFGGKEGLFAELARRWQATEVALADPELPLAEVVANYARASTANRSWSRLLMWSSLAEPAADDGGWSADTGTPAALEDLRRRQAAGEIPADLDPGCVLLAFMAAASAPVAFAQLAREIAGPDADPDEFAARYTEHLARLVRHLGAEPAGEPG